jgi:hypothetical protein
MNPRRSFLRQTLAMTAALGAGAFGPTAASRGSVDAPLPAAPSKEPQRPDPIAPDRVKAFVVAGHRQFAKVKEMLTNEPRLIDASWDLGAGDWETALGAAGHVGNREIALYLLGAGARFDVFAAAMLGWGEAVKAAAKASPATVNGRGPHGYSLMYHVGYSGDISMADALAPHLTARGRDCNQALESATQSGHLELVRWLLANGVDDPSVRNFGRKTPLDIALERGFGEIAKALRAAGGITSVK